MLAVWTSRFPPWKHREDRAVCQAQPRAAGRGEDAVCAQEGAGPSSSQALPAEGLARETLPAGQRAEPSAGLLGFMK